MHPIDKAPTAITIEVTSTGVETMAEEEIITRAMEEMGAEGPSLSINDVIQWGI